MTKNLKYFKPQQENSKIRKLILNHFQDYAENGKWNEKYLSLKQENFGFWLRMKRFEYFLKKIDVSGVVDIGCGTGNYLTILPKKIKSYLGLDFSQNMIDFAKNNFKKNNYKELKIDFKKFDILNDSTQQKFDAAVCSGLIEYFENPNKALKKIINFINKDKYLLIQFPNSDFLNWGKKYKPSPGKEFMHNRFTYKEAKEIIEKNCKVLNIDFYSFNFFPFIKVRIPFLFLISFILEIFLKNFLPLSIKKKLAQNFIVLAKNSA